MVSLALFPGPHDAVLLRCTHPAVHERVLSASSNLGAEILRPHNAQRHMVTHAAGSSAKRGAFTFMRMHWQVLRKTV